MVTSKAESEYNASSSPADDNYGSTEPIETAGQGARNWDESSAPDGGMVAWLALLSSWCMLFSIGTFQGYYEEVLLSDYSASTVAWIPSLQIFFAYLTNPFTGRLYDLYGPRYLVLAGSFLQVFGLMMTSLSTKYYQILLAQGICTSIGMSAIYVPATALIAGWFDKKRGLAYGIATSGSSLGGVIFPIMISRLIPQVGFPWAMRSAAFLSLGLLMTANIFVRSRQPPNPKPVSRQIIFGPFYDIKLMLVNMGYLVLTFGQFIPINFLIVEALEHGMRFELAHYLIATLNAGSLFGRIFAGMFADIAGAYNTFVFVSALAGILVLALYIPASSSAAIFTFSVLFGATSGAYIALIAPLVVKISPLAEAGYRIGLVFFLSSFSGLATNPIGGAIIEQWDGNYTGVKVYAGVMLLGGTGLVFVS
ncbi:Major facilitator superfamily domain general substrate transporter [Fusarium albosuccineum]|uniref:Major facilitator superfamily domain general substrate transporter n=1 Tax=Fusarium albosuccineum TaxID=1237068 RepID=A0A8H4P2H1_9HYPO|nr:Major facilitator superfamily domain general substrate transporter [Fusarium albosuccineum]